ncbi:unnamed protein product [Porites evermanni]|uniref:STING ligand-binding domain-containing protein n=1 Tax=Porites evermanni TaxID=104178 RepID=A0ABN8R7Y4_9CNID|nr:unnamed protein product [Porites evermanni]
MSPQLLFLVGWRELSSVEVSMINERDNNTIGGCLAWSYYFDYLKLVLPHLNEGILQSVYRYKIEKRKLFILLPRNTINMLFSLTVAGNLESYEINRGGILKKPYKHTVHRIEMPRPDGEIDVYYLVLEYAFPLMSLFEMSQHVECGLSRRDRDEQMVMFFYKLREILDGCKDCSGKYELVPISGAREEIADELVRILQEPFDIW